MQLTDLDEAIAVLLVKAAIDAGVPHRVAADYAQMRCAGGAITDAAEALEALKDVHRLARDWRNL